MANTKSSKMRILTNFRDYTKNVAIRSQIKTQIKKTNTAITEKADNLQELISKTVKSIDTAVSRGILHKRTAARKKSRLMKKASVKA